MSGAQIINCSLEQIRELYRSGKTPTDIIRFVASLSPKAGPGDMQGAFVDAFALGFYASIPVTWWWIDGRMDLPEEEVNLRLRAAIEAARSTWDRRE